jgi:hypothetical protein
VRSSGRVTRVLSRTLSDAMRSGTSLITPSLLEVHGGPVTGFVQYTPTLQGNTRPLFSTGKKENVYEA